MHLKLKNKFEEVFTNKHTQIMLVILAIAFVLRGWGIWFGLPYLYHDDEGREVIRALQLGAGSFDYQRTAKGGCFYLLFFEYGIYFAILKLIGAVQSTIDFAYSFIRNPSTLYLIGRVTTALIGTFNVFLVYLVGKQVYSSRVGVFAALFLAFNFLHAQSSHYITVDVPMTCLATLTLWYAIRIVQTGRLRYYVLSALFAALAIQTKIPAVMLLISLLIAHFFVIKKEELGLKQFLLGKRMILGLIVFVIVLISGNPGSIINFKDLVDLFSSIFLGAKSSIASHMGNSKESINLWLYYLYALKDSMGFPFLILSMLGVLYGLFRHKKEDTLLCAFVLSYYIVISVSKHPSLFYSRYIIPVLPILLLLGASLVEEIAINFGRSNANILSVSVACLLVIEPGYRIVQHDYLISHKDTRTFAKEWIEQNIPAGSKILIGGSRTKPAPATVPLQNCRENITRSIQKYLETEPGKAEYLELELRVLSGVTYDLVTVGDHTSGTRWRNLSYFKKAGVEYMVLRPGIFDRNDQIKANFYESLKCDPHVTLIKKFEPNPINRPGPKIEIYRIKP